MKDTLKPGIEHEFRFRVPASKTVPALYPEAPEFQEMPEVFATGFMIGFLEWACIVAIKPHLDWPAEQTVGTHVNVSHSAATPPGLEVTARVKLVAVDGRRLTFEVEASRWRRHHRQGNARALHYPARSLQRESTGQGSAVGILTIFGVRPEYRQYG